MTQRRLKSISAKSASLHAVLFALGLFYPLIALMRFFQGFDPQRQAHPDDTPLWVIWGAIPWGLALLVGFATLLFSLAYNISLKLLGRLRGMP